MPVWQNIQCNYYNQTAAQPFFFLCHFFVSTHRKQDWLSARDEGNKNVFIPPIRWFVKGMKKEFGFGLIETSNTMCWHHGSSPETMQALFWHIISHSKVFYIYVGLTAPTYSSSSFSSSSSDSAASYCY